MRRENFRCWTTAESSMEKNDQWAGWSMKNVWCSPFKRVGAGHVVIKRGLSLNSFSDSMLKLAAKKLQALDEHRLDLFYTRDQEGSWIEGVVWSTEKSGEVKESENCCGMWSLRRAERCDGKCRLVNMVTRVSIRVRCSKCEECVGLGSADRW